MKTNKPSFGNEKDFPRLFYIQSTFHLLPKKIQKSIGKFYSLLNTELNSLDSVKKSNDKLQLRMLELLRADYYLRILDISARLFEMPCENSDEYVFFGDYICAMKNHLKEIFKRKIKVCSENLKDLRVGEKAIQRVISNHQAQQPKDVFRKFGKSYMRDVGVKCEGSCCDCGKNKNLTMDIETNFTDKIPCVKPMTHPDPNSKLKIEYVYAEKDGLDSELPYTNMCSPCETKFSTPKKSSEFLDLSKESFIAKLVEKNSSEFLFEYDSSNNPEALQKLKEIADKHYPNPVNNPQPKPHPVTYIKPIGKPW